MSASMALRRVPVETETAPTTHESLGDKREATKKPGMAVEVGSAEVEFALGQPSPKPAPSSPPDEDFMDAQDMEETKALKEAKRPRVPPASRGGPVVNFTPGHPPSWHFKQLFGRSESKDEEEVSGVFPALPPVAPTDQARADPPLKSRQTPPPRPTQNPPPVALAYSSSPYASRRSSRERRRSSSPDSLTAAVKTTVESAKGNIPGAASAAGGGGGVAPTSTVSSTTTGSGQAAEAAPTASVAAPWFSSSSGRAKEKTAALGGSAAASTSELHQQAGTSASIADTDVFLSTRLMPSTDPMVAAAVTAPSPTTGQKEQKTILWNKVSAPEQQQQQPQQKQAAASQEASNGQQAPAPELQPVDASADATPPAAQPSPPVERTMSLKAAAILGVTVPDADNRGTATATSMPVATANSALVTESEDGGGRSSPPRRGSFSRALSGEMLGRWRGKKGKVLAPPRAGVNVSASVVCHVVGCLGM